MSLPQDERPTTIFSSPYCIISLSFSLSHLLDPRSFRSLSSNCTTYSKSPQSPYLRRTRFVFHSLFLAGLIRQKNKGLSEWYSPVVPGTGLHPRPGSATSLRSHFPQIDPNWSSIWYPTQKGETVSQVHDRSDGFLTVFLSQLEEQHQRILLMSHAAPIITLVRSLVGDRQLPLLVGCCSLSELVQESGGGVGSWKPIKLADTTHLDKGPLREWGFDYVEIEAGEVCHSFFI